MRGLLLCVIGVITVPVSGAAIQGEMAPAIVAARQQEAKPPAQDAPKLTAPRELPSRPEPLANVRLDVTITDQRASGQPTTKTVSLVLSHGAHGRIRTTGDVRVPVQIQGSDGAAQTNYMMRPVALNVDAHPVFVSANRVRATVTLEYKPTGGEAEDQAPLTTTISEMFTVILEDGKPLVVSQSADPTTDRRVRVEVKATILK